MVDKINHGLAESKKRQTKRRMEKGRNFCRNENMLGSKVKKVDRQEIKRTEREQQLTEKKKDFRQA